MNSDTEVLDVLDWKTGKKTGQTILRGEAHRQGVPHQAMHLWVYTLFEDQLYLLFQQRSFKKKNFPGQFGPTVGGHVGSGEGLQTLVREASEEVGLKVSLNDMEYLGYNPFHFSLPGDYEDREWIEDWRCLSNQPLNQYRFNDGEVIGLAMIKPEDLLDAGHHPTQVRFFDGKKTQILRIEPDQWVEGLFESPMFPLLAQPQHFGGRTV